MASRHSRRRGGFTRVDLLAVLGLITLVVPLLLPSLRDASERAKVSQCVSNLQGLMRATDAYLKDYGDSTIFFMHGSAYGFTISTWAYGGQTNDDYWRTALDGAFFLPATERPLNPYLLGALVQPDKTDGVQTLARTPVPQLRCPSDRYSPERNFSSPSEETRISCYDDVGTSYQYNLYALMDTNIDPWGNGGENWTTINRALVRDVLARHSSVYTFYMEAPMDYGLPQPGASPTGTLQVGNHGELGKHSAGYLDGHADYIYRDTRRWCGVGWAAIVPSWRYNGSLKSPPVYYSISGGIRKNCDP